MRKGPAVKAIFIILLPIFASACSSEPREYDFAVSVAGGPQGWPVWVEDISFDETWSARGGSLRGGYDHVPPGGAIVGISPKPAPSTVHARWFSFRTQTFYEATFSLPSDLDGKLRQWYRDYPLENYSHTLIVGFSGMGEALAWWEAFCSTCSYDRSHDFHMSLAEDVVAEIVEGDPSRYNVRTSDYVEEGIIPPPSAWLSRQADGDAEN